MTGIYSDVVNSEECVERFICEMGSAGKNVYYKDSIIRLVNFTLFNMNASGLTWILIGILGGKKNIQVKVTANNKRRRPKIKVPGSNPEATIIFFFFSTGK